MKFYLLNKNKMINNKNIPSNTKKNYLNEAEMLKYKECRRFQTYRNKGHFYFDKIWRDAKIMTIDEAYVWLSNKLQISIEETHFSLMDNERCSEAIWFCQQLLNDNRRIDLDFGCEPITPFYVL